MVCFYIYISTLSNGKFHIFFRIVQCFLAILGDLCIETEIKIIVLFTVFISVYIQNPICRVGKADINMFVMTVMHRY